MAARVIKARSAAHMKKLADDALKARLYVSGWTLSGELLYIRDSYTAPDSNTRFARKPYEIAVAYEDGVAVGVSIINDHNNLQVFVRKAKRHNGYGRKLVRKIRRDGAYGICGLDGEGKIFTKNGIDFI